jgi:3-hydroxyisobutyrate dehydrogenase
MVKHFLKDLGIALAEAERMRLDLPGLALAKRLFERVQAEPGGAERGTQAIIRAYGAG